MVNLWLSHIESLVNS